MGTIARSKNFILKRRFAWFQDVFCSNLGSSLFRRIQIQIPGVDPRISEPSTVCLLTPRNQQQLHTVYIEEIPNNHRLDVL